MISRTIGATLCSLMSIVYCSAEPVRIAHQESFPPYAAVKDGKSEGLAVDIVRAAAAQAGIELAFVPVPLEQLQLTLQDGRAIAYFPAAMTPERRQLFDFTAPLLVTGGALYVRTPNATPENLAALSGKIVVTPRAGPLAAIIQRTAPEIKLVVTTSYEESLARLVAGEADAAALDYQAGAIIAARLYPGQVTLPRTKIDEAPLAIAVRKGKDAELLSRLDRGLAAIRANGTLQEINDRWGAH